MARRVGKAWTSSQGWVSVKPTAERDYTDYEDAWWAFLIWTFRWFPDKLLDICRGENADYARDEILQRVMERVYARKSSVAFTGTRGITKTYSKMKYEMVNGLVWPATQVAYFGPSYKQMASIGSKTFRQIEKDFPTLAAHWRVTAESKDDFKIETDCGSAFYISAMRGDNIHAVTAEEFAQEDGEPFDHEAYGTIVMPAVRLLHNINGEADPNFVAYKDHSITSAGRKQNPAFQARCDAMKAMTASESAFAMDISWECVVLQQMRPYSWVRKQRKKLSAEKWMREMESRYTGADEFPVLSDEVLTDSQRVLVMETEHCCKDPHPKLAPEEVIYIVGYDVSYEDSAKNAKCACVVLKLTRQREYLKRDRFLKQLVYIDDWPPPDKSKAQARRLKAIWNRFCYDGSQTYIAIDSWQYGRGVLEDLMTDLGDGLPPLCVKNHAAYAAAELPGAIPVIYPIKAGGTGVTDPDFEMLKYAQTEFEHHNVELLTLNANEGVEAYKRAHRIRDDDRDYQFAQPYQKCRELSGQIQNLKLVPSGAGMSEKRISKAIQRDSWSATKYALRLAQLIEREELLTEIHGKNKSDWASALDRFKENKVAPPISTGGSGRLVTARRGGRRF